MSHLLLRLRTAIMKRTEPFVQRQNPVCVVTFKIFVMQIMGVAIQVYTSVIIQSDPFKASMTRCRAKACVHQSDDSKGRMEGEKEVEQNA